MINLKKICCSAKGVKMVKCSNCGVEVSENFDLCPNCGSNLNDSSKDSTEVSTDDLKCSNCGVTLAEDALFCPECGTEVESENNSTKIGSENNSLKCNKCGFELPENVVFCPNCGEKADNVKKYNVCPNCGAKLAVDSVFCDECGTNLKTGENQNSSDSSEKNTNNSSTSSTNNVPAGFIEKINIIKIIAPTVLAIVFSVFLSMIGLLIGFSWISFFLALIISVGFFAASINNEANALISGLITGLVLGVLEIPLVKLVFGLFVGGFYNYIFGEHILPLIVVGGIIAFVSNLFLKNTFNKVFEKLGISW